MTPTMQSAADAGRDRGQLLLITGILVAVVVIATVVLLNGIRFTDNTGTGEAIREAKHASQTVTEFQDSLRVVFAGVENNSGPYVSDPATTGMGRLRPNVTQYNETFADLTSYGTSAVTYAEVDGARTVNGTVLGQSEGEFLNATGEADWTLVEDLGDTPRSDVPYLQFTLENQSVDGTSDFVLRFADTDSSPTTALELEFTEQNVRLARPDLGSSRQVCARPIGDHRTVVTVRQGAIKFSGPHTGGCELVPLNVDPTAETAIDEVQIENGDQADGSFVATVEPDATVDGGAPVQATNAIVNPAVSVAYDGLAANTTTTVYAMEGNVDR